MSERPFKHTPQEARKLWVDALRSGEFKQCKGMLCRLQDNTPIGHCCLGVACEVFCRVEEALDITSTTLEDDDCGDMCHCLAYNGRKDVVPRVVQQWLGLSSVSGWNGKDTDYQVCLAERNDDGEPFSTIADIIESAPPGLFVEEVAV